MNRNLPPLSVRTRLQRSKKGVNSIESAHTSPTSAREASVGLVWAGVRGMRPMIAERTLIHCTRGIPQGLSRPLPTSRDIGYSTRKSVGRSHNVRHDGGDSKMRSLVIGGLAMLVASPALAEPVATGRPAVGRTGSDGQRGVGKRRPHAHDLHPARHIDHSHGGRDLSRRRLRRARRRPRGATDRRMDELSGHYGVRAALSTFAVSPSGPDDRRATCDPHRQISRKRVQHRSAARRHHRLLGGRTSRIDGGHALRRAAHRTGRRHRSGRVLAPTSQFWRIP